MSLPKFSELYLPFLTTIQDGAVYSVKEVRDRLASSLHLSEDDLSQLISSNRQSVWASRFGWANTYLKKAGLVIAPKAGHCQITDEGKRLLNSGVDITNHYLAEHYPAFEAFVKGKKIKPPDPPIPPDPPTPPDASETPPETLERVYSIINERLADDLLTAIIDQTPSFFETLVVDLMKAMGYGDGFVTKATGDGGVDGIIYEDKLGFNLIYIQAKRWNKDSVIGKPEIQKFAGAMMGPPKVEKGLFITTAKFSQGAMDFAKAQHIILVDGEKLTELMIEYNLGVSAQKTYQIKRIDSDYFSNDSQ